MYKNEYETECDSYFLAVLGSAMCDAAGGHGNEHGRFPYKSSYIAVTVYFQNCYYNVTSFGYWFFHKNFLTNLCNYSSLKAILTIRCQIYSFII